jgi:Uncharacterized protein conserved in bacteria (DUF2147)
MKTFYLAASLLMASTAAHAGNGISFQIDGHKVHIAAPKNCSSLDCIQVTAPGLSGSGFKGLKSGSNDDDDRVATSAAPPAPANVNSPAPRPAPVPVPVAATPPPARVADASPAPAPLLHDVMPSSSILPPPAPVAASTAPDPVAAAQPTAAAPDTPVGLWATQDNKGNVQIEQCGQNLCGYSEKTREQILINMKPSADKWTGRIHDPSGGSNYDSTIAMKGPNTLKVQGCAFGGLFCGGQTWKRIS